MARGEADRGWAWMIVLGVTIINVAILPVQQCFGLIFAERFTSLGITATQTSLILHLNGTITCSLGLISGPMMKRFSFRKVAFFGALVVAVGICTTAFALSFTTIIISYCIIIGMGQGIVYPATGLAMNTYFRKRRSMAMGFAVTLTGLGPIVMPLLIDRLLEKYATTGTLLIFAGIATHAFVGASLLRPFVSGAKTDRVHVGSDQRDERSAGDESEAGKAVEGKFQSDDVDGATARCELLNGQCSRKDERNRGGHSRTNDVGKDSEGKASIFKKISRNLDLDLLRDNRYIAVVLGMSISLVAETNFSALLPFVLVELAKLDRSSIATVMSIQAAFDIAGRLCVPLVAQRVGWTSRNLYIISLLGFIAGRTLLSTWGSHYSAVIGVAIIVGVARGTKAVFQALIIPDYVPLERLPAALGIQMVCNGILSIIIGPLIGVVRDATKSYVGALHFTSALSFSCVFLWVVGGLWTFPGGRSINIFEKNTPPNRSREQRLKIVEGP